MEKTYVYAYTIDGGIEEGGIYELDGLKKAIKEGLDYCDYVVLKIDAKTYENGRAELKELVNDLSRLLAIAGDASYSELQTIYDFLEPLADYYGLAEEFHENGIL